MLGIIVTTLLFVKSMPALNVFWDKKVIAPSPLSNVRVPDAKEAVELYSVPSVTASALLD